MTHTLYELNAMSEADMRTLGESLEIKNAKKMELENLAYAILDEEAHLESVKPAPKERKRPGRPKKESPKKDAPKQQEKKQQEKQPDGQNAAAEKPAEAPKAQEQSKTAVRNSSIAGSYGQVSSETREVIDSRKLNFRQDLDVRGMRGDEAINAVTYFIDDAILVGMSRVRILHGTGTGVLRQLIRQYLATVPNVSHYRDEHVQFGGAGITVVDID